MKEVAFNLDKMYCGAVRRGDVMVFEIGRKEKIMVVLQDQVLNSTLSTIIGAVVEPKKESEEIFINEVLLKKSETGLDMDGVCLLHQLVTVDRRQIVAKKSELNKAKLKVIFDALDITLGRFRDR